ncbi:MAG: hypothetical protein JNL10_05745 [Verrucomicrobiales bacterium]|nr:hypothetical protein [Verrucomicrobiales bacterium]
MAVGWVRPDVVSWQQGAFGSLGIWISLFGLQPLWLVETLLNHAWPKFVGPWRWILKATWCAWGLLWLILATLGLAAVYLGHPIPGMGCALGSALAGIGGFHWFCAMNRRGRLDWTYPARP